MRTSSHFAAADAFPGLRPTWARLDGPAGSQVHRACAAAIGRYLTGGDVANLGGESSASIATADLLSRSRHAVAELHGRDASGLVFGPSSTVLLGRLATTVAPRLGPGDELLCSALEHDANVAPWRRVAAERGAELVIAPCDPATLALPTRAVTDRLSGRTRVVAVTAASNVTGARPDLEAIAAAAHRVGAVCVVDAVHAMPHGPDLVAALPADALVTSAYKWFGPHVAVLALSARLMDELRPPRIRPGPAVGPPAWEAGALPFELLAGLLETTRYVRSVDWPAAREHEDGLLRLLLDGLAAIPGVRTLGDPPRRTSTAAFTVDGRRPAEIARALAAARVAVTAGDCYAVELFAALATDGCVRAGVLHYTDVGDVERLLHALARVVR